MVMEPPTAQCVGREFARQYYTLLNSAPAHLHRFYNKVSSFVHGGIDGGSDGEVASGQNEIHKKIVQLNFKDCKTKIRKVDSHRTLGDGVVVQVSGELSNNGEPMRRFVQTFVLAPQNPKHYYVHNDIFRYQDETVETDTDMTANHEEVNLEAPIQILAAAPTKPAQPVIPDPIKQEPVQETFSPEPHMNGGGGFSSPPRMETMVDIELENLDWKSGVENNGGWKEPAPEEEEVMAQDEDAEEEPEGPPTPLQDTPSSNSNEPMSWSSRVKMGSGSAAKPPAAPVAAAPVAAAPSKEGTPFSQPGAAQGKPFRGNRGTSQGRPSTGGAPGQGNAPLPARPERFKDEEPQGRQRMMSTTTDHYQLFVGNLPHDCTEQHLQDLFLKYGKVSEVRINKRPSSKATGDRQKTPVPNFGFVVFDDMTSVELAMKDTPIYLYGKHRLNIEEKKTKSGGGPMFNDRMQTGRGERGSQDNLRGAGHPGGGGRGGGGGGGSDRGRGSGGRGGGRGRGDLNRGRSGGAPPDSRSGFRGLPRN